MFDSREEPVRFGVAEVVSRFITFDHRDEIRRAVADVCIDGRFVVELEFLRQIADHEPLLAGDSPGVGGLFTGSNAQEARFSAAVTPDQAHLLPCINRQGRGIQHGLIAEGKLKF